MRPAAMQVLPNCRTGPQGRMNSTGDSADIWSQAAEVHLLLEEHILRRKHATICSGILSELGVSVSYVRVGDL